MRKFIPRSLIFIISGFYAVLSSCTPQACFDETESYVKASFFNTALNRIQAPDSLTLYGLNLDSIIYKKTPNIQPALFPLNSSTDNCAFVIKINGIADTIQFRYISYPHLVSKECGYTFYHLLESNNDPDNDTLTTVTKHKIKTVTITKPTITTLHEENIRIFY